MPAESWGEPTPPPSIPKPSIRLGLGGDGELSTSITSHSFTAPAATPTKVTINGVQLGAPASPMTMRRDPIGENVVEISLTEAQVRKLAEQNGVPYVDKNEVDLIVDSMTPTFEIAEKMKKTLAERGWTYEEAERVAADFMREMLVKGVIEAQKDLK